MTNPSRRSQMSAAVALAALGCAASPAVAQGYGPYAAPYSSGPTETVTIVGPRFHADSTPLNGPLEKVSLSSSVRYDDLDIASAEGAAVLRWRIYDKAKEVCERLRDVYPVYRLTSSPPCIREAVSNALVKADAAITDARLAYWNGY